MHLSYSNHIFSANVYVRIVFVSQASKLNGLQTDPSQQKL